jgi:type I restriction enzyme S subunit
MNQTIEMLVRYEIDRHPHAGVRNVPLYLSSIEQQIIQEIESRLSVCDGITGPIISKLKQPEALQQSILKKAIEKKF